jgi:hypothetical protein
VIGPLPKPIRRILRDGVLCYLASPHSAGPHVTPVVYAAHASRLWVTTSRSSVKAKAWRRDPRVGGLVRAGDRALVFSGTVATYDLLDPATWPRSVLHAPSITRAATAFTTKNTRFSAGYAVDAYRVPLAWTPPGRVFAAIAIERAAVIGPGGVERRWGRAKSRIRSSSTFRASRSGDALEGVPEMVRQRIGERGDAALGLQGRGAPVVLPARWAAAGTGIDVVVDDGVLALATGGAELRASVTIDHASQWRARAMTGVLAQGDATIHRISTLRTGRASAARIAERAGFDAKRAAIVRVRPRRIVWWRGWDSGTVKR